MLSDCCCLWQVGPQWVMHGADKQFNYSLMAYYRFPFPIFQPVSGPCPNDSSHVATAKPNTTDYFCIYKLGNTFPNCIHPCYLKVWSTKNVWVNKSLLKTHCLLCHVWHFQCLTVYSFPRYTRKVVFPLRRVNKISNNSHNIVTVVGENNMLLVFILKLFPFNYIHFQNIFVLYTDCLKWDRFA